MEGSYVGQGFKVAMVYGFDQNTLYTYIKFSKNKLKKNLVIMLLLILIYNPPATIFWRLGFQACRLLGSRNIEDQVQSSLQAGQVCEALTSSFSPRTRVCTSPHRHTSIRSITHTSACSLEPRTCRVASVTAPGESGVY